MYLNRAKFSKLHGDLVLTIYHHTLSIFLCVSFSPVICLGRIYWKVLPDLCKCHFFIKHHPQIFHITSSFKLLSWIFLKLTHILIVALFYLSEIYQVFWTALVLLLELILFPFIVWYADSNLFFFPLKPWNYYCVVFQCTLFHRNLVLGEEKYLYSLLFCKLW